MKSSERNPGARIALNVTRTRVTVLVFNLTIIFFMLSALTARHAADRDGTRILLTTSVALFCSFCLTLLGLWLLLLSQEYDEEGLSRPWPFTLGAMTVYVALSQTVTAFMHEYLLRVKSVVGASMSLAGENSPKSVGFGDLDETSLLIVLFMGSATWGLTTYVGPVTTALSTPVPVGRRWVFAIYYLALQVPVYWIYAAAWSLQYGRTDQPADMLSLFALQFAQPALWFR